MTPEVVFDQPEVVFETGRQNMNTDKYLSMTDAYLKKTSKGETPEKITRDLRFCMDEQQDRLQKKGLTMSEEYVLTLLRLQAR
jgi:hypothetical protein